MGKNRIVLAVFAAIALMGFFTAPAKALSPSEYTVAATSYPVTEVAFIGANISGAIAIEQIYISANSTATPQTVDIYKNCGSTTTATLVWRGFLAVSGVTEAPMIKLEYPLFNTPLYITDVCFRKSDAASIVRFNVHYR